MIILIDFVTFFESIDFYFVCSDFSMSSTSSEVAQDGMSPSGSELECRFLRESLAEGSEERKQSKELEVR